MHWQLLNWHALGEHGARIQSRMGQKAEGTKDLSLKRIFVVQGGYDLGSVCSVEGVRDIRVRKGCLEIGLMDGVWNLHSSKLTVITAEIRGGRSEELSSC